jgi:hypothetical protein
VPDIIAVVRERWFSRRAIFLHLGFLLSLPLCVAATWWQITRAEEGNDLSYLYSVMWPVFAILSVYFWWMLLHIDYDAVGLRGMRNQASSTEGLAESSTETPSPPADAPASAPRVTAVARDNEAVASRNVDPELAAYNDRLAALAARGAKTWRKPETHVARRAR